MAMGWSGVTAFTARTAGHPTDWWFFTNSTHCKLKVKLWNCKVSSAPELTPDFHRAMEDLKPETTWVAAPVKESYPVGIGIQVTPLPELLDELARL